MPDHVRRASQRAPLVALLALFAVAVVGPTFVVAAGPVVVVPEFVTPAERPVPREQKPGRTTGFQLPFAPGVFVPIHQGWNSTFSHIGRAAFAYDFGLPEGTPVLAAAGGVVAWAHDGELACGGEELRRKSNYVTINHPDGSATHYGHMLKVGVEVGEVVAAGQRIGLSGKSGFSGCLDHLHFARQEQGAPVTHSVPVYFDGYARELRNGETITKPAPACAPGNAGAKFAAAPPPDAFCATYSPVTEGAPAYFSRIEPAIDFDWALKAPGGYWLDRPVEGFAARWTGQFTFTGGTYEIGAFVSDRIRVTIDGLTVLNYWSDHPEARYVGATWQLLPGSHVIEVDHLDSDGQGSLSLRWDVVVVDNGRWSRYGPLI